MWYVKSLFDKYVAGHDNVVDFIPDYLSEMAQPTNSVGMAREWFYLEDANHDGVVSKQELVDI